MPRDLTGRPVVSLLRLLWVLLVALSLTGVTRATEGLVETATHVADAGHGVHADARPDCPTACPEHYCFGAVHHCGCCSTVWAVPAGSPCMPARRAGRVEPGFAYDDVTLDGIRSRIDRPPRA